MRSFFFLILLLISGATRIGLAQSAVPSGTGNKTEQRPQPNYDPPNIQMPDDATLKRISEKTEQLRQAISELKQRKIPDDVLVEVEVYLKGAEHCPLFRMVCGGQRQVGSDRARSGTRPSQTGGGRPARLGEHSWEMGCARLSFVSGWFDSTLCRAAAS